MNLSDLLVIGDVYIITNNVDDKVDKKVDDNVPNIPKIKQDLTSFKQTLKKDITDTVKPGVIHRPTPGELMAKDEPEIKKQANEALRETLDKIPELQEAKAYLRQQDEGRR